MAILHHVLEEGASATVTVGNAVLRLRLPDVNSPEAIATCHRSQFLDAMPILGARDAACYFDATLRFVILVYRCKTLFSP